MSDVSGTSDGELGPVYGPELPDGDRRFNEAHQFPELPGSEYDYFAAPDSSQVDDSELFPADYDNELHPETLTTGEKDDLIHELARELYVQRLRNEQLTEHNQWLTEQNRQLSRELYQARVDGLTRIYRRDFAIQVIDDYIENVGDEFAMFFIDLDGLKAINDTQGHEKGNDLIYESAQRLASAVRPSDLVFRYGGDEMCVCVPLVGIPADERAGVIVQIERNIRSQFAGDEETDEIQMSLGRHYSQNDQTAEIALYHADVQMYIEKSRRRIERSLGLDSQTQEKLFRQFVDPLETAALKKRIDDMQAIIPSHELLRRINVLNNNSDLITTVLSIDIGTTESGSPDEGEIIIGEQAIRDSIDFLMHNHRHLGEIDADGTVPRRIDDDVNHMLQDPRTIITVARGEDEDDGRMYIIIGAEADQGDEETLGELTDLLKEVIEMHGSELVSIGTSDVARRGELEQALEQASNNTPPKAEPGAAYGRMAIGPALDTALSPDDDTSQRVASRALEAAGEHTTPEPDTGEEE